MSSIILPKEIGPTPFLKYRDKWIELPYIGKVGIGGYYRVEAYYPNYGASEWLTPWFHNNITNSGLDMCTSSNTRYHACQLGSGNTPPQDTDTTLVNRIAGTTSMAAQVSGQYNSGPIPSVESYLIYTFPVDGVSGNITEVGIGPSAAAGQALFSRELIRDEVGAPIVITPPGNSQIRVHYRIRHYPPIEDVIGTINGNVYGAAETRQFTRRASQISSVTSATSNQAIRWQPIFNTSNLPTGNIASVLIGLGMTSGSTVTCLATGGIGSITGAPTGIGSQAFTASNSGYTNGSFTRTVTRNYSHSTGAFSIKSLAFSSGTVQSTSSTGGGFVGMFQIEFDTIIPKGVNDTFTVVSKAVWGRYTPP